jgi:hypothetical protein
MARSMLHRLEDLCNVDVDDADPELIKSIPFTPHNRASFNPTSIFVKDNRKEAKKELTIRVCTQKKPPTKPSSQAPFSPTNRS